MQCQISNDFKGSRKKLETGKVVGLRTQNHQRVGFHWDEITTSAESCFICDMLTRGIRGSLQQHNIKELDVRSLSTLFYYENCVGDVADTNKEFRFRLADGSHFDLSSLQKKVRWCIQSYSYVVDPFAGSDCLTPSDWETFPTYERTSPRIDSNAAIATIRGWIEDCLGPSNEFCTAPTEAELPSRVIDVGIGDSAIRLVELSGTVAEYICLSHCWGKEQIITTKKFWP
jgi:hypothetical protein